MKQYIIWIPLILVSLYLSLPSLAQEPKLSGARKEGKVVVYNTTVPAEFEKIIQGFRKRYPFLDVESYRSTSERLLQKILTEVRAGRYLADVYLLGLEMHLLKDNGLIVPYLSPEREWVKKQYRDEAGHWTGIYFNLEVIGHNTRRVSPQELPKRWEDLLNPRWKARIGLETGDVPWFAKILQIMGEERGKDFARKLAKQQMYMRGGHGLMSDLMSAGEFDLTPTSRVNIIEPRKAKGMPVEWMAIEPLAPDHPTAVAIAKNGPHPYAARLFIDFILSKEGQLIVPEIYRNPTREDVEMPYPRTRKLKLFDMNWEIVAKNFDRYQAEFNDIFGIGR